MNILYNLFYVVIKYMCNYILYIYSFNKLFFSGLMVPPPTATDHPTKTPIPNMKRFFFEILARAVQETPI